MSSTIGIIGGLGPEGTVHYYRKIAKHFAATLAVEDRPGVVIDHLWMERFVGLFRAEAESQIQDFLSASLMRLHRAGADLAMVAAVTPHMFLAEVRKESPIEIIDLVEATQQELISAGHRTIGLLGTRQTLTRPFFKGGLEQVGIRVVVPDEHGVTYLDDLIFGPLASGTKTPEMRRGVTALIRNMTLEEPIDALVVACTDLMDLVEPTTVLVDPIDCHIRLAARAIEKRHGRGR
jgi:aspartate racemase